MLRIRPRFILAAITALVVMLLAANAALASGTSGQPSWSQFGRTAAHLNTAPQEDAFTSSSVANLGVAWQTTFGTLAAGGGGAAVADGVAYIGGSDGFLSAFSLNDCSDGTCVPLWTGKTHNGIYGTPAVVDHLVLVGSADRHLYAFPQSGCGTARCAPVWRGKLQAAALGSVAVSGDTAYIGDYSGHLYAFPVRGCYSTNCSPTWTGFGGENLHINTTPAVSHGHVFIGAALNTQNLAGGLLLSFVAHGCGSSVCQPEWEANLHGIVDGNLSPLVSHGVVYAGSGTQFGNRPNGPRHLFAFDVNGCGSGVCVPLWSYATGAADLTGGLALSDGVLLAGSQSSPNLNTEGVVTAFSASCSRSVCKPLWWGINFASGFESPPVVAGDMVFVAKGPASGFPVDEAVLSYPLHGCGKRLCRTSSFTSVGDQQFYLGSPIAVADHTLFVPTEASVGGIDSLTALQVS
jgi:outer membrane protein assembly factor BamB